MNNKNILIAVLAVLVLGLGAIFFFGCDGEICLPGSENTNTPTETNNGENGQDNGSDSGDTSSLPEPVETGMVKVSKPLPNSTISSPLIVRGEARGNWYFEASFPVRLLDANGNELAVTPAQAQGDWMTTEFVPFEATLNFQSSPTATGTLVLEKDNPSGLPENAGEVRVPVRFSQTSSRERSVVLYYYNSDKDTDSSGNVLCSAKGLVGVERTIPVTNTPIQDTIELLIEGNLTSSEKARGISTEYPLDGFTLTGANLVNGKLTLGFSDPNNATTGGSCRTAVLWSQIQNTAKQFSAVNTVEFTPNTLFQP